MEGISDKIINIEDKLKRLSQEVHRLRSENASLRKQQAKYAGTLFGVQDQNEKVAAQKKMGWKRGADVKRVKKEIDQYMREIDKCIEWLQQT
ncbi:MAG: hypothetical protein HKN16_00900 [Saprospiraceae bacterium]|nr:hypothetical protein [Saprospiraceae bacterium]